MNLRVKFNLVLSLSSIAGIGVAALFSHHLLQKNAEEEVLNSARIMMESAIAVRAYTVSEIKPLVALSHGHLNYVHPVEQLLHLDTHLLVI